MRVVRVIAYRVRMPLRKAFSHARASRAVADNIVVEAAAESGTRGYGEGVPREYVTGETPESAMEFLRRLDYTFLSEDWGEMAQAAGALRAWEEGEGGGEGLFPGAARCALSLALLDAAGREWGCGAGEAAASAAAGTRPVSTRRVRYSAVCSGGSARAAAVSCAAFRLYGFRAVKLKVGWGEERDVAIVRTARRIVGRGVDLRVDANGAWDYDAARRTIPRLAAFGISSVEEPLCPGDRARLPELRRETGVPVMLDESFRSRADLARLSVSGACDLVNIRISKCGGLFSSLARANEARAAGLGFQMGCQVGESGVLSAAGRHFAFLAPDARHLEGSYDRHLLAVNLTREDVTFGYGGSAPRLTGAGLGVTVDRAVLERYAEEKMEVAL